MKNAIRKLLPEIAEIKDAALAEKVVQVYQAALAEGGFAPEAMEQLPFTLLLPTPISYRTHVRAVTGVCLKTFDLFADLYGQGNPLRRDLLLAGALLHDVGKLVEYEAGTPPQTSAKGKLLRHPLIGAGLCYRFGLPYEVINAVALHSHEGDKGGRTPEGKVIHHADFINFEPFQNK